MGSCIKSPLPKAELNVADFGISAIVFIEGIDGTGGDIAVPTDTEPALRYNLFHHGAGSGIVSTENDVSLFAGRGQVYPKAHPQQFFFHTSTFTQLL